MNLIQNTFIGFRCPNTLKDRLAEYANDNNLHVSQVIRQAVTKLLKETAIDEQEVRNRQWISQQ